MALDLGWGGSSQSEPIYYGSPAPGDTATVALVQGGGAFCTGTLITPTVVLTAGHCLEDMQGYEDYVGVFFGSNANNSGTVRSVARMAVHPSFSMYSLQADIALIQMTSAAPSGITPIPHLPSTLGLTSSDVGASVRFVGFGYTETGRYGERRQVTGEIGRVCTSSGGCSYLGESVVGGAFAYPQDGGGPCQGDSGGPAFIVRGGTQYVAGVTSYGDYDCQIVGVSTTVDDYQSFIESFIGTGGGGTDPGPDPDPPPAQCTQASCMPGAPCSTDGACGPSGFCIDVASNPDWTGGYCSSGCASHDDCPSDGLCVDNGGEGICLDGCTSASNCRSGYVCDTSTGYGLCLPGGGGGGIDPDPPPTGGSPSGGACFDDGDCGVSGSACYDQSYGFPGGLCTKECVNDSSCGAGAHCSEGICLETCTRTSDCRAGWVCWPEPDLPGVGACWVACDSDEFCEGLECNSYGLCGDMTPPNVTPDPDPGEDPTDPGEDPVDPPPGGGGDGGTGGGTDGGTSGGFAGGRGRSTRTDPEATGCAAAMGQPLVLGALAVLALRVRRRRK